MAIMDVERQPKPAYFAYRDALSPLMVSLRTDRQAFVSGQEIQIEAWICNDTSDIPENAMLHYQVEMQAKILATGKIKVNVPRCSSRCCGVLKFTAPEAQNRDELRVRLGLVQDQRILHDTVLKIDIFKPLEIVDRPIQIIGAEEGRASQLTAALRLSKSFSRPNGAGSIFLIDDYARYWQHKAEIDQSVRHGALALFIELPVGNYPIAGTEVSVQACGMGDRHFVSRKTGHALVRDFQPDDFKFWYDVRLDHPAPLLFTTFEARGWTPILTSGNGDWQGNWHPTLAAAEKRDGAGVWRICQVQLSGRIAGNPVAEIFARRLLNLD